MNDARFFLATPVGVAENSGVSNVPPVALTIAGSDCSGGAGVQADLKVFTALGVYGMSAITCVVAETPKKVVGICPMPVKLFRDQLACCLDGMPIGAIKTGMLYSDSIIRAVKDKLAGGGHELVVDPVMVASSGKKLLQPNAIRALKELLPLAKLVTPNVDEAVILSGQPVDSVATLETAARKIFDYFGCAVYAKGGHLRTKSATDIFFDGRDAMKLESEYIKNVATHGTGCTFSACVTAHLARGKGMQGSIERAKRNITEAIRNAFHFPPWTALNQLPG
jgi:hydroxymethylpyrimidine/phosphomethylpyrimidine kinase